MIIVSDYSTETGLRVRIACDDTDTTIHMPADQFHKLVADAKAGKFDELAKEPRIPFIY
jgi:hypothetical protein